MSNGILYEGVLVAGEVKKDGLSTCTLSYCNAAAASLVSLVVLLT